VDKQRATFTVYTTTENKVKKNPPKPFDLLGDIPFSKG